MIDWLVSQVASIWATFTSWASSIYSTVRGWFNTAYQYIATTVSNIYNTVRGWFTAVYDYISSVATNILNTARAWFNSVYDYVTTTASNLYNTLRDWFNDAYSYISTVASNILATAREWINTIYSFITTTASNIYSTIKTWFNDVYDWALGIFAQLRNLWATILPGLEAWWTTKAEGVRQAIASAFAVYNTLFTWWDLAKDTVVDFFSDLPGKIQSHLPWTWLWSKVEELSDNLTDEDESLADMEAVTPSPEKAIDDIIADLFPEEGKPKSEIETALDEAATTIGGWV